MLISHHSLYDFTDQQQPKSVHARAEEEVTTYCRAETPSLSEDPLCWWKKNQVLYPMISKLAKRYLCIPGTSVSAERVFSTAGDIVTAQRSTLDSEHVDQLLFLHKNLKMYNPETDDSNADDSEDSNDDE